MQPGKHSYDEGEEDRTIVDDEAAAPLCNPSQDATKPPLPDKTASPAQVTAFVTQLLIVTRDLTETQARHIASRWAFGTGQDLLETYPAQMYREVFGSEIGWMVYKEVKLLQYETSHPEQNHKHYGCIGLSFTVPIMMAVIFLGPVAVGSGALLAILTIIAVGLFAALGVVVSLIMVVAPKNGPLQLAEGELKDSFFKASKDD